MGTQHDPTSGNDESGKMNGDKMQNCNHEQKVLESWSTNARDKIFLKEEFEFDRFFDEHRFQENGAFMKYNCGREF